MPNPADPKAIDKTFVAVVDPAELAVRMCEANYGIKRPCPDAAIALDAMDQDAREGWLRSAKVAADYFAEIINQATRRQ